MMATGKPTAQPRMNRAARRSFEKQLARKLGGKKKLAQLVAKAKADAKKPGASGPMNTDDGSREHG